MNLANHRCWVEIDLAALERNLFKIRSTLPSRFLYVAVVKANAYGHGLHQTVARLMQSGADYFAVANVFEAAEIRQIGSGFPILILGPVLPGEESFVIEHDLIVTVSTEEEVERFNKLALASETKVKIHFKIDTGMGRIGVWYEKAPELYQKILKAEGLELCGVFTHFSSADDSAEYTRLQRSRFLDTLQKLPGILQNKHIVIHADNSAGLESLSPNSPFNAVRVGLLQFGVLPYPGSILAEVHPEPVLSFHARVGLVKMLPKGTFISYNRTHQLAHDTKIAVITAGYGDGVPRELSNRGEVIIHGKRCPILGRVTMDQTIVDATAIPEITVGDVATFIGKQSDAEIEAGEFSKWANDIPWAVFCSISKRVDRIYRTPRMQ